MLRAFALVAIFAAVHSVSVLAAPSDNETKAAGPATESQSGTTTFFGDASKSTPEAATEKPAPVAAKPKPLPPPTLTASIDLSRQTMSVSVNGEPRYSWVISSGTSQYPTPTGNFHPQWTSKMWYSRKYDNAPMPHAVFINGGVAVHGTYHLAALGSPASHGCIRLAPANAKTFYNLVQSHGLTMTRVSVHGRPNWRDGGAIASRRDRDQRRDEDVASSGSSNWFWGNSWGSDDSAYDTRPLKKKDLKAAGYVMIDGVPTKVYRRKNGDYVYKVPPRPKKYYYTYGYAN
ncbi:L,D-transpeptidase [Hyphomicrobium sp. 99]|uniref:L,D-transpeptidase n=1 Tax=Hyphomicrobium sp. 99 TaxID=1163419 RepID=UPI0005F86F0E|nr:L,D-transpeptidase [Hyphomicrobium sp. 99]